MTGPAWVTSVDVADSPRTLAVPTRTGAPYGRARVLVRDHGVPVRFVETVLDPTAGVLVLDDLGLESSTERPEPARLDGRITVVVCTRDRPELLALCLTALAKVEDDDFDVVVVDNASTRSARAAFHDVVGGDERFALVHEPRPGLSRARNRGVVAATGIVVAFTDDDVLVDPGWLDGVRVGFGCDSQVGCVTGLVPAAELEEPVQEIFDRKVSWSSSLERRRYDLGERGRGAFPYDAGRFGTGANFAVRTRLLHDLGGFDVALGAGSRSRGGEDLDAFVRIVLAGHHLVYEPRAIVWHVHRGSRDQLGRQMFAYGVGLSAYITKLLLGPDRWDVVRRVGSGVGVFVRDKAAERVAGLPPSLLVRELAGCGLGPVAYLRARREARC